MFRDPNCPYCRIITSGDCGRHGYRLLPCGPAVAPPVVCQECERLRARLALAERLCRAVVRCEQGRGRFSCSPLHDSRCLKGRTISRLSESTADAECTCGGDEYQLALVAWEEADG
jgi:hypothetical protein